MTAGWSLWPVFTLSSDALSLTLVLFDLRLDDQRVIDHFLHSSDMDHIILAHETDKSVTE